METPVKNALTNKFIKGHPFINLIIGSVMTGGLIGAYTSVISGLSIPAFLIAGAIFTVACFLIVGADYMHEEIQENNVQKEQGKARSQGQERVPEPAKNIDYCYQEPDRKSGIELMERGNRKLSAISR